MELYFKTVDPSQRLIEIIDTEHPNYCFRFEGVTIKVVDGQIEADCQHSILEVDIEGHNILTEEQLTEHADKIMNQLLESIYRQA